MKNKKIKVIFDTNVWISFLIGKQLSKIKQYIVDEKILIVITNQLLEELELVTSRDKLKQYFPETAVKELIELLKIISLNTSIKSKHFICRDEKDNFLLDLIDFSKADFLITGDKDLLEHNPFMSAKILTPAEFEKELKKISK